MKTEFCNNVLIIVLESTYTIETIAEITALAEFDEKLNDVRHIIVDCTNLEFFDNGGGEVFLLRKHKFIENILFCGLNKTLEPVMNFFSQEWFQENIKNFPTKEDALDFINKSPA